MQESSQGVDHSSDLRFHVFVYAGTRYKHVRTFLIGYRSGGTPCVFTSRGALLELRAVDEGAVPASAPANSRLFVLPVTTHRWVSTDNTFWHARWDTSRQQRPLRQCLELKIKNPLPSPSRMKNSLLNTRRSMMRSKLCLEADLIGSFERTRNHGIKWKGFSPEGALDNVDLSVPSEERTRVAHGGPYASSALSEPDERA